jgi:hypothetical protein
METSREEKAFQIWWMAQKRKSLDQLDRELAAMRALNEKIQRLSA